MTAAPTAAPTAALRSAPQQAAPFWFGTADAPLFGWYHAASAPQRDCGVVLCAPFGHEYLVSYRAYRKLAEQLAAAGFPCVFFDYLDCGDSAPSPGPRLRHWQHNIAQALEALRQHSGVRQCALFGLRLGALLAAAAASQVGAAALVLVAPVVTGRAYLRELQALARMSPIAPSPDPARAVRDDEVAGYHLDPDDQATLSALDLRQLPLPAATALFLARRDDGGGQEGRLIGPWQAQGRAVALASQGGYAALMTSEAESSVVPEALWREITDWLATAFPTLADGAALPRSQAQVPALAQIPVESASVIEQAVNFDGLSGMLSRPTQGPPSRIAVILTNIGAGHRVGNHGLYVQMARALALQGLDCLRFERGGCGYSRANADGTENLVYAASGADDIRAAMNGLQALRGQRRFILVGLCSGGYFSYEAARVDERVHSLIMINNQTFVLPESAAMQQQANRRSVNTHHYYLRALLSRRSWAMLLRGELSGVRLGKIAQKLLQRGHDKLRQTAAHALGLHALLGPQQQTLGSSFTELLQRQVHILFICAADDGAIDVARLALGRHVNALGRHPLLQMDIIPHTDHTFTPRWSQRALIARVVRQVLADSATA